ncbi:MAG: copper resistance CopC family protein [Candidatus Binatia bacterium]
MNGKFLVTSSIPFIMMHSKGEGGVVRRHATFFLSLLLLFAPTPLFAHAYLVKSVPAQRAMLYHAPAKIQLWFNERLEPRYSSLTLSRAEGSIVEIGKVAVSAEDPKQLTAALALLPAGRYVIKYRVLSVDGHIVQDQFPFTVKQ